jgi:DNA-binding transcriptional regulator YhcF (GntR family)
MGLPDEAIATDRALSEAAAEDAAAARRRMWLIRRALVDEYAQLMSVRRAAQTLDLSPTTVQRARAHAADYQTAEDGTITVGRTIGLDGKLRPSRRFDTTARDNRIRELGAGGRSVRAIAAEVGCSVGTVHRVLKTAP